MVVDDGAVGRALGRLSPRDRREADRAAAELAPRLEFLTWDDRAALLDQLVWSQAKARLPHEVVTAVIGRRTLDGIAAAQVEAYTLFCGAVATAALAALREPAPRPGDHAAALTYRLSLSDEHREPGGDWFDEAHRGAVARELARRPGYAFLLLAQSPDDSAESFLARDAFLAAMLGGAR